ncbi:MAG: hypothetical protein ABJD07_14865 [Gemmatimonadaceae bacterium]
MGGFPTGSAGCLLTLFLDGQRVEWGDSTGAVTASAARPLTGQGFDAVVPMGRVHAVEIYPTVANTPARFQSLDGCGSLVVWTKRE